MTPNDLRALFVHILTLFLRYDLYGFFCFFKLCRILWKGWYTVNAKLSDRFDQTWFEWSFQFKVEREICKKCKGSRDQYIEEITKIIQDYKKKRASDPKFQKYEKSKINWYNIINFIFHQNNLEKKNAECCIYSVLIMIQIIRMLQAMIFNWI